jgi:hypothetical protein
MQVFQTAGVPPRRGKIILAIMGWTRKSKVALTNKVKAKKNNTAASARRNGILAKV